ncbi:MAG: PAS domain S-box protein, partial [Nitrospirae bacterium]|nr:PAS domain S-box protein [Nitrospirota bacterium]
LWLVGTGGIVTLTRNIQGQQQKITESESKFRTLSEFAYDWEYWIKDNMEIVFMSPSCERLTGYTQEEFLNNSHLLCDIVHPDDRAVCDMHMRDFTASQHDEIEFRIITKNGETRWLSHICGPINVEKKFLGRRVSNRDITDRKTAEIKLESAIKDWQNTFNTIEDSIVILSPDNRILKANLATSRLLSIPLEDIVGKRCYEIFHKMDTNYKGCPHLKTLTLGKSEHLVFESEQVNKIFEVTVTPVMGDGNEILSTIHIVKDITGRKKLEEQLVQSQKMESLGLLAGGIAHDFNNLLTAITGYSSLLEEGLQDSDEKTKRYVQHIMSASEKAQNLTSNLLTFSRKQIIKPSSVSLNEVIENISGLLKRLIGEDIDLRLRCSDAEFPVFADPHQIEQVVMNLVTNARDAMPSGGMVSIETAPVMLDSEYAEKRGVKAGRYMMLSVSDSGTGIDKNELAHIFEPFFTTKEKGKGTGLGLSMVYSIIKQHGGFIDLYSEKNIGTTFKLYIPASTFIENSQQKRDDSKPRKDVSGRETILVAEDEELVREFLKDIFETYGYKAIIAVDGEDAIAKYNEHKEHVDMIVLDVIMPRKNGKEVYNYIREINPDIKTLFISGYTQGILTSRGVCEEDLEFVSKPLEAHGLMSKIRSILDKNASEGCVSSAESP